MSRSQEFKQSALFPGHTPTDVIESATPWAEKVAGPKAKAHYVSAEENPMALGQHRVSVTVPGLPGQARRTASYLDWSPVNGVVSMVSTQGDYQGRGLASGLWNIAKSLGEEHAGVTPVQHSDVQTPKGKQWAKKVGD